jgi:hypothetical protein
MQPPNAGPARMMQPLYVEEPVNDLAGDAEERSLTREIERERIVHRYLVMLKQILTLRRSNQVHAFDF